MSVLGSWLRDYPQDFWDPPAHSDLGSVCTFLGWAAPSGAEAREAEQLLGDFLKDAEPQQEEEEQSQTWAGERVGELIVSRTGILPPPGVFSPHGGATDLGQGS